MDAAVDIAPGKGCYLSFMQRGDTEKPRWVRLFIGVARLCLSKTKDYPYEVDSSDDVLLNARCKKGPSFRIALFLGIGSPVAGAGRCSTLTWG